MQVATPQNKYNVFSYTLASDSKEDFKYGSFPFYQSGKALASQAMAKNKRNQHFVRQPFAVKK